MRLLFSWTCLVYMHLFVELFMYNDDDIPSPSYDSLSDNTIFLISILSIKMCSIPLSNSGRIT